MDDKYFGIAPDVWKKAVERIREILVQKAKDKQLIYYSELSPMLSNILTIGAHDPPLHHMLGEVSSSEDTAGRGLLSVLVIDKENHQPGHGFFDLARERGRDIADDDKLFAKEVQNVFDAWMGK
ncbi:MAG: hypothetical protein Q7S29_00175 [Candidatus Peribacter sp.]|nr:hypothetical protein [Candidatus Peribacter sp.]